MTEEWHNEIKGKRFNCMKGVSEDGAHASDCGIAGKGEDDQ